jgi:hypothetical protein
MKRSILRSLLSPNKTKIQLSFYSCVIPISLYLTIRMVLVISIVKGKMCFYFMTLLKCHLRFTTKQRELLK